MSQGPGYTVSDLVFYVGLFAGIIITYGALEGAGVEWGSWTRIFKLLIGLGVGLVLGYVCLKVYEGNRSSGPRDDQRPPDARPPSHD